MGHRSSGEGPREPRSRTADASGRPARRAAPRASVGGQSRPARRRSGFRRTLRAAGNDGTARKVRLFAPTWVAQSTISPRPSASGKMPASVTSRQSRGLSVVLAAMIQLASRWVSGDTGGGLKAGVERRAVASRLGGLAVGQPIFSQSVMTAARRPIARRAPARPADRAFGDADRGALCWSSSRGRGRAQDCPAPGAGRS